MDWLYLLLLPSATGNTCTSPTAMPGPRRRPRGQKIISSGGEWRRFPLVGCPVLEPQISELTIARSISRSQSHRPLSPGFLHQQPHDMPMHTARDIIGLREFSQQSSVEEERRVGMGGREIAACLSDVETMVRIPLSTSCCCNPRVFLWYPCSPV
ncbi:uncharacterized protein EV420DRAFT_1068824 [Desarmillaria tabescens]|uniref:Uncharacterized protein n=1 Tax=Armillaria tabescens TaxID=1929756 RepID=A0AA39JIZ4_ARMTA|nr:uncharacterized protein EV420DRAFT_1068824 [Desarmillaria tabescens]KAK0443037.1 hypothetical protein EV420DRAFT_1068824 [Desarmillaria tabescens]